MVTSAIRRRPAPLHQERPSLVAALVHSGDLVRIVDTDGVIVYASDSAERLLGYRPNELVGMRMSQLHHPDEAMALALASAEVECEGTVTRLVHRSRRPDGSYQWLETVGRCLSKGDSRVLILVSRDATSQVGLGRSLTASRQQVAALLDSVNEPILLIDADEHVLSMSSPITTLVAGTNSPRESLSLQAFCQAVLGPEDAEHLLDVTRSTAVTGQVRHLVVDHLGGDSHLWHVRCTPVAVSQEGQARGVVVVFSPSADPGGLDNEPRATLGRTRTSDLGTDTLTGRERDVLASLGTGLETRDVADALHISEHTVRGHIKSILLKLQVHTQLQAVLKAIRAGIVRVDDPADE